MTELYQQLPHLTLLAQKIGRPISIFDLETTGLLQDEDLGITEIGLLSIFPDGRIQRFQSLVNPEYDIPDHVVALNGINNQMVSKSPIFSELWTQIQPIFSEHAVFGFNSNRFDVPVLSRQFQRYDISEPEEMRCYDVRVWHQIATGAGLKGKLAEVATQWQVPIPLQLHRAPADVEVTTGIMERMLEECGMRPIKDARLKYQTLTPNLFPAAAPLQQQAQAMLLESRRSASDIFSWISVEMGVNGYQPLPEWSKRLNLNPQHLEELLETAIDTKSLAAQDFRHGPTQKWLQQKNRLEKVLSQAYPTLQDIGKLHYPHQILCAQMAKEKPSNVILDFIQLRIAMMDLNQPYVTRRGLLESSFKDIQVNTNETNSRDLFAPSEQPKKPRPRFS